MKTRGHVSDAALAAVRAAGCSDGDVLEIILHIALNTLTNYLNSVAATPIDFPVVKRPRAKLLRRPDIAQSQRPARGTHATSPASVHRRNRGPEGPDGRRCLEPSRPRAGCAGLYRRQPLAQPSEIFQGRAAVEAFLARKWQAGSNTA